MIEIVTKIAEILCNNSVVKNLLQVMENEPKKQV